MGWMTLASLAAPAPLIILSTRPRPSYLFTTGIFLTACVGMCSFAIFHRLSLSQYLSRVISNFSRHLLAFVPAVLAALIIFVPSYYPVINRGKARPLLELYEELAPYKEVINTPDIIFAMNGFSFDIQSYLVPTKIKPIVTYQLVDQMKSLTPVLTDYSKMGVSVLQFPRNENAWNMPINQYLDRIGVNLIYVDSNLWTILENQKINRKFVTMPESVGWQIIARQDTVSGKWMLLRRNEDGSVQ